MSNKYGLKYIDPITGNFNRVEYMKEYYLKNKEQRNEYMKEYNKEYSLKNKERLKEYGKEYRLKNKEQRKEYRLNNKEKTSEYNREYYLKNKEKWKEYRLKNKEQRKEYRLKNKERLNEYGKEYRLKNKEKVNEYNREYRLKNKEKWKEHHYKEKRNEYCRNRRKTDIGFRILNNLRTRTWYAVKGEVKSNTTIKLLGCNISYFKIYIESLFKPWMTWENYGTKWSIDHIIPCAAFDLNIPEQQQKCFHYSNLQPLDAIENIKKGSMYDNKRYRKTYEKK